MQRTWKLNQIKFLMSLCFSHPHYQSNLPNVLEFTYFVTQLGCNLYSLRKLLIGTELLSEKQVHSHNLFSIKCTSRQFHNVAVDINCKQTSLIYFNYRKVDILAKTIFLKNISIFEFPVSVVCEDYVLHILIA